MDAKKTEAVIITGGADAERSTVLGGALDVADALALCGYGVSIVDTCRGVVSAADVRWALRQEAGGQVPAPETLAKLRTREARVPLIDLPEVRTADVAFLVLGDAGPYPALLESIGVRCVGNSISGTQFTKHKRIAKSVFRAAEVPTPDWLSWPVSPEDLNELSFPLVVKPARGGLSVGVSLVHTVAKVESAVELASRFDDEVLIERYIEGRDFTVGILGDEPLSVGEIVSAGKLRDFGSKVSGLGNITFPAAIDDRLESELKSLALRAHRALDLRHVSRADFRVDSQGAAFCLEVNGIPGIRRSSFMPRSAAAAGIDYETLCDKLCKLALGTERRNEARRSPAGVSWDSRKNKFLL